MGYSAITLPNQYMAAYSAVPLKLYDSEYDSSQQYKYIVNAVYDTVSSSSATTISYNGSIYTLIITSTPHNFVQGDSLILDDSVNNNLQTGYYNVLSVVSPTSFIIDLFPSVIFASYPIKLSKFYKWKLTPDLEGYGKLDMSNVMKDLVTQDLTGETVNYGLTYGAPNTRKCFGLLCGYESQYVFEFQDNIYTTGGTLGFQNSNITDVNDVPFQVGDVIQIQQNPVAWLYTGITAGVFAHTTRYSSNQIHSFLPGQQVQVQGQTTLTSYNGYTSISNNPVTTTSLFTNQAFVGNSTVPGYIYGVPRPQYNTTATIVSIYVIPIYGLVIQTNLGFQGSTVPVSGQITFPGNQLTQVLNQYTDYDSFCVYNAHINRPDYTTSAFDKYVIQNRPITGNNISTIFNQSNCYRIEPNTIGFLLSHTPPSGTTFNTGMAYEFFNSAGGTLGTIFLPKSQLAQTDWYAPIGLGQISQSPYTNFSNVFSSYSGSVASYNAYVYLSTGTLTQLSNKICFKLNEDCSMYEVYSLMWKDQYGSFVSYPFIYMSREFIESDKKTYYQQEGTWKNDTFGYDDYGVGEKTFYQRSRESFTLNSGWLYEFERDIIKDLMQSPSVYIQTPDNRLFNCHLDQPKVELFKNINEQLFSYTFNVRVSNNEFRF
jgi:hypothetical protein